jgi:hypothetical protein
MDGVRCVGHGQDARSKIGSEEFEKQNSAWGARHGGSGRRRARKSKRARERETERARAREWESGLFVSRTVPCYHENLLTPRHLRLWENGWSERGTRPYGTDDIEVRT